MSASDNEQLMAEFAEDIDRVKSFQFSKEDSDRIAQAVIEACGEYLEDVCEYFEPRFIMRCGIDNDMISVVFKLVEDYRDVEMSFGECLV